MGMYLNSMPCSLKEKWGKSQSIQGCILGVGIVYDRAAKKHECKIEVLRKRLTSQ